jgi:hypothetical protein
MWPVYPVDTTLLAIGILLLLVMISVRLLQPAWWSARPVRIAIFSSFAAMLFGVALWSVGTARDHVPSILLGTRIAYVGVLVLAPAALTLPFTALLNRLLLRLFTRPSPPALAFPVPGSLFSTSTPTPTPTPAHALSRRAFIHAGTASLPALGAIAGARGLTSAGDPPRIPVIPMRFENLHPDLEGLRILQLSDLHLGACAGLADLAKGLDAAISAQHPDLIVLTGDLADDPALITGALELVARANARHGALASLGNHEYLHDIEVTRPKYEASAIPLLVSAGQTLTIGRAKLFIGGADDPVHMHGDIAAMLRPSIERAAADASPDADFRLLLCHRPEGFGPAAELGFDLTLSGHTHGGQIGLFGRSIFEKLMPGTGWWGTYARPRHAGSRSRSSPARLYTTSGFGHWFPFRIGCPTEMPILVLEGTRQVRQRLRPV